MIKYRITLAQTGESKIIYGEGIHIDKDYFSILVGKRTKAIIPKTGFMIEED